MEIKTKIVCCHTADSKPVKREVNCTVILPPLVFPGPILTSWAGTSPANIGLGWKGPKGTTTLAYLSEMLVTKTKKYYKIDTRGLYYKTVWIHNVQNIESKLVFFDIASTFHWLGQTH